MYLPRTCQGGPISGSQVVPGSQNINWSVSLMGFNGLKGDCGCGCGGKCGGHNHGLGQALTFPNLYPPFESTDYTTWGWEEYSILGLLGYGLISAAIDMGKGAKKAAGHARKGYRKAKSRVKKAGPSLGTVILLGALVIGGIYLYGQANPVSGL
jgi:hypothetical protein